MFRRSMCIRALVTLAHTHFITHPVVEHKAHFTGKVSMAIRLLLGSAFYNKRTVFLSPTSPQPLLILSRLPATRRSPLVCPPSYDSGVLCLRSLPCFSTLSTTGLGNTELCLPFAPDTQVRALPERAACLAL